eukprot:TRINITY_DN47746_c0_g1_i1.p2 TRINITY_DN47746_c0_g1~~TRINITY_DN47746_c0_g1_i1.p2  ORF type:complete len:200 (-),score=43.65 TRINITY_DN47746_c0_g1_i1:48-647(-)
MAASMSMYVLLLLCTLLLAASHAELAKIILEENVDCSAHKTCDACLAPNSQCHGWFGDECCSKEECESAAEGDRFFYTSCAEWKEQEEKSKKCEPLQNDACACIEAGCVAQTAGEGSLCFAQEQPSAGRPIERDEACTQSSLGEVKSESLAEKEDEKNSPFCPGSAEQLCRMYCPPPQCPPGQCVMRHGPCCDMQCEPL